MSNHFFTEENNLVLIKNSNHKKRNRSIKERASSLPEVLKSTLQKLSREGSVEEFFDILGKYGIPLSEQEEYASHFMREFKEGLRVISWTKERLMYLVAILENTLSSKNPNISSSENMIRNYLIFSKIFEKQEGFILRFGQFSYVIRGIFGGIKTREDIFRIIQNHKTFGESRITREEAEKFIKERASTITSLEEEFSQKIEESKIRLKELKETIQDAIQKEEQSKGLIWSTSYTPPRQYEFPNYIFQTGSRRGLNTVISRSSWEAMFLAFSDVINKMIEEQVNRSMGLSDEQRRELIKKRRMELLYEPFDFPIGIKKEQNGKERLIIYRPDFIDINRWRVIEIKGPLTPEAREKIKAFEKYYIEQDFSDLPEDERIIMMRLVMDKLTEIKRWCKENNYPVYDRFKDFQVFGIYRWDKDLNNFNRYDGIKEMVGISEKTKESLRKGLIKFIEEQIERGKYPDIRPSGYIETRRLRDIIEIKKKQGFRVESEIRSVKPYLPKFFINNIKRKYKNYFEDEYKKENQNKKIKDFININQEMCDYILTTLPIPENIRRCLSSINLAHLFFNEYLQLPQVIEVVENQQSFNPFRSGIMRRKIYIDFRINHVISDLKEIIRLLSNKNNKLLKLDDAKKVELAIEYVTSLINLIKNNVKNDCIIIDRNFLEILSNIKSILKILVSPVSYIESLLLDKHFELYRRRTLELDKLFLSNQSFLYESRLPEHFLKILEGGETILYPGFEFFTLCDLVSFNVLSKFNKITNLFRSLDQFYDAEYLIAIYLYIKEGNTAYINLGYREIKNLARFLSKIFISPDNLLDHLSNGDINYNHEEFSIFLNRLFEVENLTSLGEEDLVILNREILKNRNILIAILELAIKNLTKDHFEELNKLLEEELSSPLFLKIKQKLYNLDKVSKQK